MVGKAKAERVLEEVAPGNRAGHRRADWRDDNRGDLGSSDAGQPVAAEFGQHAQTVMTGALGPGQVFVKGGIGLREIEVGAFRQPETQLIEERERPVRAVRKQQDGLLEVVMQGSQQRQAHRARQSQSAQAAAGIFTLLQPEQEVLIGR